MNPGAERIRRFSMLVWMIGTLAVASIAFAVFPRIAVNPQTGDVYVGDGGGDYLDYPWFADDPDEYEVVDGVLHGTREGGFLRLPAGDALMMLTTPEDFPADYVRAYQQLDTEFDTETDAWEPPGFVASLWPGGELLVMPGTEEGVLWFAESLADWTATVTTPETIPLEGSYSGTGNAVLLYEGDALSGRFQHSGGGLFIVSAVTVGDWESLVNESDDVDVRVSWPPTDRVAIFVESDTGDGEWTITLDTPAGESSPTPDPTGTP